MTGDTASLREERLPGLGAPFPPLFFPVDAEKLLRHDLVPRQGGKLQGAQGPLLCCRIGRGLRLGGQLDALAIQDLLRFLVCAGIAQEKQRYCGRHMHTGILVAQRRLQQLKVELMALAILSLRPPLGTHEDARRLSQRLDVNGAVRMLILQHASPGRRASPG